MFARYVFPENKELYIAHNDPKKPVLVYRDEGPWPNLPEGCWASPNVVHSYIMDWNNPNVDEPFITEMNGGTVSDFMLKVMKLFKVIRKPTDEQMKIIEKYRFYKMLKKFDQERIDAGVWKI